MYFYPLSDFSFSNGVADINKDADNNFILDNYYNSLKHDMINLTADKNYCLLIKKNTDTTRITKDINLFDTVEGNVLGSITFYYEGEQIGETPITNGNPSLSSLINSNTEDIEDDNLKGSFNNAILKIAVIIVAIVLLVIFVQGIMHLMQEKKRNDRRRKYTSLERKRRKNHKRKEDDFFF